jgi:hypothetical protein
MSAIRRCVALPAAEQLLVSQALALLAVAPLAVRLFPLRHLLRIAIRVRPVTRRWPAGRLAQLVESVAVALPWRTTCLHRALVTAAIASRQGVAVSLYIGVRRESAGLAAHAWTAAEPNRGNGYTQLAEWPASAFRARR